MVYVRGERVGFGEPAFVKKVQGNGIYAIKMVGSSRGKFRKAGWKSLFKQGSVNKNVAVDFGARVRGVSFSSSSCSSFFSMSLPFSLQFIFLSSILSLILTFPLILAFAFVFFFSFVFVFFICLCLFYLSLSFLFVFVILFVFVFVFVVAVVFVFVLFFAFVIVCVIVCVIHRCNGAKSVPMDRVRLWLIVEG